MELKVKLTKETVIGAAVGAVVVGATSGYFLKKKSKVEKQTAKRVDEAIKSLANMTSVEISDEIINKAAYDAARAVAADGVKIVISNINGEIKSKVNEAYSAEAKNIAAKIHEEISNSENLEKAMNTAINKASENAYNDMLKKMKDYNDTALRAVIKNSQGATSCATLIL